MDIKKLEFTRRERLNPDGTQRNTCLIEKEAAQTTLQKRLEHSQRWANMDGTVP
ncbi:mCG1035224 [Mus musculus]|nr:mCG1035224 [Mus musculus]